MIPDFVFAFPGFKITAVLAEALYGESKFMDKVRQLTGNAQVTSLKIINWLKTVMVNGPL